jgi:hypothetical protein
VFSLQSAFNLVSHTELLDKLRSYGLSDTSVHFKFKAMLTGFALMYTIKSATFLEFLCRLSLLLLYTVLPGPVLGSFFFFNEQSRRKNTSLVLVECLIYYETCNCGLWYEIFCNS